MPFPRIHAPELMDEPWWPEDWRRMEADFLRTFNGLIRSWTPIAGRVTALLRETGGRRIVDLCSGGGGLVLPLRDAVATSLGEPVDLVLTDLYPNPSLLPHLRDRAGITYVSTPVDARAVPADLTGLRTLCLGLHHLRPADAAGVLADAARARQPIVVYEVTARSVPYAASMVLLPALAALLSPLSRPRSLRRMLWHTALPVVPLALGWDGFCSCLRSYEPDELRQMAQAGTAGDVDYAFEVGRERWLGVPVTWVVGRPLTAVTPHMRELHRTRG